MSWGHKITIHAYVEGDHKESESAIKACYAAEEVLVDNGYTVDFVGADIKVVEEEPKGQ